MDIVDRLNDSLSAGYSELRKEAAEEITRLRKELDELRAELKEVRHGVAAANDTIKALQAKVEAMEKQFPICRVKDLRRARYMTKVVGLDPDAWLYLAPGAQPAPNLPVDLITDYLVSISAHVAHQDDPKAQAEIGELLRMLASAPEAKP